MGSSSIFDMVQTVFCQTSRIRSTYAQAVAMRAGTLSNANLAPAPTYLLTLAHLAQVGS